MTSLDKKTTAIGSKNKLKRNKNSLDNPKTQDIYAIGKKSNKLTYYILGGLTFSSVIIIGVLTFKYFESSQATIKNDEKIVQIKNDNTNDEEYPLYVNPTINLDPKTKEEQYLLGVRYIQGNNVHKNYTESIKWFTLAATQEHGDSQLMLGKIYYYGEFIKPDFKKALMWNTLAAAQGLSEAQYMLGLIYEKGNGVNENKIEAKKWYSLAAEQGLSEAKEKLLYIESSQNYKKPTPAHTPKLVTQDDLNQVNKYLSNIHRNQNKKPKSNSDSEREIIWN